MAGVSSSSGTRSTCRDPFGDRRCRPRPAFGHTGGGYDFRENAHRVHDELADVVSTAGRRSNGRSAYGVAGVARRPGSPQRSEDGALALDRRDDLRSPDALAAVLRALADQSDPDFDVVVADDGSGPATERVVDRRSQDPRRPAVACLAAGRGLPSRTRQESRCALGPGLVPRLRRRRLHAEARLRPSHGARGQTWLVRRGTASIAVARSDRAGARSTGGCPLLVHGWVVSECPDAPRSSESPDAS